MKAGLAFSAVATVAAGLLSLNPVRTPQQQPPTADACMDDLIKRASYLPGKAEAGTIDLSSSPEAIALDNKYQRCMHLASKGIHPS